MQLREDTLLWDRQPAAHLHAELRLPLAPHAGGLWPAAAHLRAGLPRWRRGSSGAACKLGPAPEPVWAAAGQPSCREEWMCSCPCPLPTGGHRCASRLLSVGCAGCNTTLSYSSLLKDAAAPAACFKPTASAWCPPIAAAVERLLHLRTALEADLGPAASLRVEHLSCAWSEWYLAPAQRTSVAAGSNEQEGAQRGGTGTAGGADEAEEEEGAEGTTSWFSRLLARAVLY